MKTTRAGQLRHRLEIQSLTEGSDGVGGKPKTPSTVETVWGSIRRATEVEAFYDDGRQVNVVTHIIETRYSSNIDEDKQIVFDSRTFQIVAVDNKDERSKDMILRCLEGVA